ncbi:MAG: hypothetical protein WBX11_12795 [Thiobacillaceae bacterium]
MIRMQSTAAFSGELGDVSSTNKIVSISSSPVRILIGENSSSWSDEVTDRLQELIRLRPGWDGYQGRPVNFVNANFALQMLNNICGQETRAPQIVPGAAGDLQIEWHTLQGDIELHVKGPNVVHAWRALPGGDPEGEELNLTVDFAVIAHWVKEITEPPIAAAAVA